jgi:hypothetical protein
VVEKRRGSRKREREMWAMAVGVREEECKSDRDQSVFNNAS